MGHGTSDQILGVTWITVWIIWIKASFKGRYSQISTLTESDESECCIKFFGFGFTEIYHKNQLNLCSHKPKCNLISGPWLVEGIMINSINYTVTL